MVSLKDVVKSRIFGGKVTFRSDMDDQKEPVAEPAAEQEAPAEAPAEAVPADSGEITSELKEEN